MKALLFLLASLGDPGSQPIPESNSCPVADYEPCGGSLQGTWTLQAQCLGPDTALECEFPFDSVEACQGSGNSVSCHWDGEGKVTFQGKTMRIQSQEAIVSRYKLSSACTAAVRPEAGNAAARCAALSRPPLMACAMAEDLCVCDARVVDEPRTETVRFTAKQGKLTFEDFQATYCAKDGQLTLDFDPHPKSWKYWVLKASPRR